MCEFIFLEVVIIPPELFKQSVSKINMDFSDSRSLSKFLVEGFAMLAF